MNIPLLRTIGKVVFLALFATAAHADWQRDDKSLAWRNGTNIAWQFNFDTEKGKPFFHPLSAGGTPFTLLQPADHKWHYGLWFSWKFINEVNYWEENATTGKPDGATKWSPPVIETKPDGSATIRLQLTYTHPSGRVDLTETRDLSISAPEKDGSYGITWHSRFTSGKETVTLDRTPLLGEPQGVVNGGYAGLGVRMAAAPVVMSVLSSTGLVSRFESDRARPQAPALACNFSDNGRDLGGLAILSAPGNIGDNTPWYVINGATMRFACAAILAPKPRKLAPGEQFTLDYRLAVRSKAWTVEDLKAANETWTAQPRR